MKLALSEWGRPDGPLLICLHGVGECRINWRHVAEDRWSEHFRVIAPDLRGHGDSGYEPPWTHATHVNDIIDTMDALGLEQADFVGHSFGGRLVLQLIAQSPERVRRAALTEPVIQITPELAFQRAEQERVSGTWSSLDAVVASRENLGDVDADAYLAGFDGHFETLDDGRIRRRTCQSAVVAIFSEFAEPAPPPQTITVPTLLLYSPAFGLVTAEQREAYEPHVAETVEVPGMHAVFTTAYEATSTAVEKFLLS